MLSWSWTQKLQETVGHGDAGAVGAAKVRISQPNSSGKFSDLSEGIFHVFFLNLSDLPSGYD